MSNVNFFRPAGAWVGDVIPWQEDGVFSLYYLHEVRREPKPGTPWHLVATTDLVHFEDRGESLAAGTETSADFNAYTGSVVRDEQGVHHLFYTGQNPSRVGVDGLPRQLVMHATSTDGRSTWQKHPDDAFGAPEGYETADWRDPFVFRDTDAGLWRMLIAARHTSGPVRRRGVIAQCVSGDLIDWEVAEPFWDPRRYIAHECPDVFQWGDWWYLIWSEFSEAFVTRYRMARSLHGPWQVPERDTIDGRAYYAAKSAERDGRRFLFGWIASREDDSDDGAWQWAGTLSVLEVRQTSDGSLAFRLPHELLASFDRPLPIHFDGVEPSHVTQPIDIPLELDGSDGFRAVISGDDLPAMFHAAIRFEISDAVSEFGVLLGASADGDEGYIIRMEPKRGRMVFDRWPRRRLGDAQWQVSGDVPFAVELERPCELGEGSHTLEIIIDGDLCVVNLDRAVNLSTRIYRQARGRLGLFAGEGKVTVTQVGVHGRG